MTKNKNSSELVSAGSIVNRMAILEQKIEWVICPMCDLEWTRLRPCSYWQDGLLQVSNICADCAETPVGIFYMSKNYPIPGISVDVRKLKAFKDLPEKYDSPTRMEAIITGGVKDLTVRCKGTSLILIEGIQTENQSKHYDNSYQVWFALRNIMENAPLLDGEEVSAFTTKKKWHSKTH